MTSQKHIAILGAGPGGYVAAIRAAQLGARVTVIESHALGGVCLNWGCIPSKALLSVVELGDKVKKAEDRGLLVPGPVTYDLARMVARKNKVVATLVQGIATLFKAWNIEYVRGTGSLRDRQTVTVTRADGAPRDVQADAIVIATGSSWPNLPQFPIDGQQLLTSQHLLDLDRIPASLLIIGAGVEGCEFAALYSGLGTEVTIVELMARVLPLEDDDISSTMERELKKRGVTVVTETTVPGIYAIGDVVGKAMLAHVASAQGKVAVENIMGHQATVRYDVVPAGIFTLPEIGRVGVTEQQARERVQAAGQNPDQALTVGRFRYAGLGKAQATGDTTGLFKVIAEAASGRILGVHIAGAHAADLVHEAAMAMQVGATVRQMAEMIHAHPTLTEGLMEAAEDVEGKAIHQARKRIQ